VAGYPSITVPVGYVAGLPVGLSFIGKPYSEPVLIKLAFALEQLHRNLIDLARCVDEFAHSTIVSIRKGGDAKTDQSWPSKMDSDRAQNRPPPADHGRGEHM